MGLGLFEALSRYDNQELTERYTEVKAEFPLIPALSDIGDASKVTYCDYFSFQLIFIATIDVTQEIIYMSYYDDDRDYITSLTDFILDDCGFKHIQ